MQSQTCAVRDTEIVFVPDETQGAQTIRIAATNLGTHLAGAFGCTQREGEFFVLAHSPEVDRTIRELVDALILARYNHPTVMQLRLKLME
jgi:hypothetical protein